MIPATAKKESKTHNPQTMESTRTSTISATYIVPEIRRVVKFVMVALYSVIVVSYVELNK